MYRRSIRLLLCLALLFVGMLIGSPALSLADPQQQTDGQVYVVQAGDSLYRISTNFYGDPTRWPLIVQATNDMAGVDSSFVTIRNPRLIYPGQKLWIPGDPAILQSVAMMQPVATAPPPPEPTPSPTAPAPPPVITSTTSAPASVPAVSAPANGQLAPIEQLLADYANQGLLAGAQNQTELAQDHLGFLQEALGQYDLTTARRHAEHVVNILDGEEGTLYGDNDRDGQPLNPGDGVGVRAYLAQAQAVLATLDATTLPAAAQEPMQQLTAALTHTQALVQTATEQAYKIFAADTTGEAEAIATELQPLLAELHATISDAFTSGTQLLAVSNQLASVLAGARQQTELALRDLGFLQEALSNNDLAIARRHAEHIVNILEGEEGALHSDNDRNGQLQDPGNGVGVRAYLAQALLAALDTTTLPAAAQESVPQLTVSITRSQSLVQEATDQVYKIFGTDTTGEAEAIATELKPALTELQATIADAFISGAQLLVVGTQPTAPVDEALLPLRDLLSEDAEKGALAGARQQTELALTHLGFLQEALSNNDLATARSHAEHVVNILDGEEGALYGDNDRDGQLQNPGNGVGVRDYLVQAQAMLITLDPTTLPVAAQAAVPQFTLAMTHSQTLVQGATEQAYKVFAADTTGEAAAIATELKPMLTDLQGTIAAVLTTGTQVLISGSEPAGAVAQALLTLRDLLSDDAAQGVLTGAQQQTELALTHLGFLQKALGENDLPTTRRHAEHLVNILEGEGGVLYGDNDRDGQPQNPGNGVGVRVYLAQAQPPAQAVLAALDEATASTEVRGAMLQVTASISRSQALTEEATAKAFQVFAADTPREIEVIAAELNLLLRELQAAIAGTFTTGTQLLQP